VRQKDESGVDYCNQKVDYCNVIFKCLNINVFYQRNPVKN